MFLFYCCIQMQKIGSSSASWKYLFVKEQWTNLKITIIYFLRAVNTCIWRKWIFFLKKNKYCDISIIHNKNNYKRWTGFPVFLNVSNAKPCFSQSKFRGIHIQICRITLTLKPLYEDLAACAPLGLRGPILNLYCLHEPWDFIFVL